MNLMILTSSYNIDVLGRHDVAISDTVFMLDLVINFRTGTIYLLIMMLMMMMMMMTTTQISANHNHSHNERFV